MPFTSSSYTSFSFSTTASSTHNGETKNWGHRSAREVFQDEDNSRHERSISQKLGETPVYEEKHFDSQGRQMLENQGHAGAQQHGQGRIEDVSEREQ